MQLNVIPKFYSFGFQSRRYLAIAALGTILMTGCATTQAPEDDPKVSAASLMIQAENELFKGRRDQAIALLNQAAKISPTNTAPWLKITNIWFDEGNYPSAIVAANEVLARDSSNQEAKSVLVVAGLRVAATAVRDLVPSGPVNSNARQEAENLTKSLRQALGEKVLVPTESAQNTTSQKPRRVTTATRTKPVANDSDSTASSGEAKSTQSSTAKAESLIKKVSAVKESASGGSSGSADPFKLLK